MADIVQLEENGVMKYLKTHAKAVEGLDKYIDELTTDSGWIPLVVKNGAISTAYYRRIDNTIIFRGYVDFVKKGDFATLPSNYRPIDTVGAIGIRRSGLANQYATIYIKTDGVMELVATPTDAVSIYLTSITYNID